MKRGAFGLISIIIIICVSFACNQQKSLQELLQEERKAIDRFIVANDLVILKEYPEDGVFKEKEYFRTGDGLFFQVVDSGNGKRARALNDISLRIESFVYVKEAARGDTALTQLFSKEPISFVFGVVQSYQCQAWVIPLGYVGENAVLNMIVPSSLGTRSDNSSILPVFYKHLRYTRFNE